MRDIFEDLRPQRRLAYTTVATVVTRLSKKKMIRQERTAAAFAYVPIVSHKNIVREFFDDAIERLLDGSMAPLISAIARHKQRMTREDVAAFEKVGKELKRR